MRKSFYLILSSLFIALFMFAACSETSETSEYENWEERNQNYLDSLVSVANTNSSGDWQIYKSYSLPADNPNDLLDTDPLDYIYVKVIESGSGDTPLYNDTVRVHYRGTLINGEVFDQSYKGTLNLNTAVPSKFQVSALITGWVTALLKMQEGDRWEVYIPWSLAYGPGDMASSSSSMLDYSFLIFDMTLVAVYPEDEYNSDNPVPEWN